MHRCTVIAARAVVGTDDDGIETIGDEHAVELACERLFVHMGISEWAHAEDRPIWGEDFEPIGKVIPTAVLALDRDFEVIATIDCPYGAGRDHIGFAAHGGTGQSEQERHELGMGMVRHEG
jgi:hypothetical protein